MEIFWVDHLKHDSTWPTAVVFMNDIFRNDIEKYSQVRLDDIIVYSKTLEEHILKDLLVNKSAFTELQHLLQANQLTRVVCNIFFEITMLFRLRRQKKKIDRDTNYQALATNFFLVISISNRKGKIFHAMLKLVKYELFKKMKGAKNMVHLYFITNLPQWDFHEKQKGLRCKCIYLNFKVQKNNNNRSKNTIQKSSMEGSVRIL
ncbi:hypothetical protein H8356DRAFT_1344559 [Neocallimastix lanati (nom. inval.)]|nr:hypothetical protein H8356DRAFT_1344559 [Neocallimastix sp. JGI-2020a]